MPRNHEWDVKPAAPEQALVLAYVPVAKRSTIRALWNLDARLGQIAAAASDPAVGAIRMAWWRDALAGLERGVVPAEPVLRALAECGLGRSAAGELAMLAEGWGLVLDREALGEPETLDAYGRARGGRLFAIAAGVLGEAGDVMTAAGAGWALVDLAFAIGDAERAMPAIAAARRAFTGWDGRTPRALRPLGMLAVLARRDAMAGMARPRRLGSPGRIARMIGHRLTGR